MVNTLPTKIGALVLTFNVNTHDTINEFRSIRSRVNVPNFGHLDTFARKNENEVFLVRVGIPRCDCYCRLP